MSVEIEFCEKENAVARALNRVLIVDDSRLQRKILMSSLSRWGFKIREASSAEEAIEICSKWEPDLVLSDWMMPGMTGPEFCRQFRKLPRRGYGYFILLTSKSEKAEIASGLDAGADDFLTKPVNAGELRARISAGDRILKMERELTGKNRIIRSTLDELQKLYDSLDNDLIEAKKLQQSLVRERHRDLGSADVSLILRSSGHVGGDLVGTFPISESKVGLYGLDVSGHGISSALMTARLAGYLSPSAPDQNVALRQTGQGIYVPREPSETIGILNRLIIEEMQTEHYFTLLLAIADLQSGKVSLAQAGHPYPMVQRADGRIERVGTGGLPVGLIEAANYQQFELLMSAGDRLLIHSDGIVECADPVGCLLDDVGLKRILKDLRQTKGIAFLESLIWKLADFAGTDEFEDDVSAVLLEFKNSPIAN